MGIFSRFPYTDFHRLNADWILDKIKEMLGLTQQAADDAAAAADDAAAAAASAEEAATGSVRYDRVQDLTALQQGQARDNIQAAPSDMFGAVRYDEVQLLGDPQKLRARSNIGAAASGVADNCVRFDAAQSLNGTQQAQARSNIDAASTTSVGAAMDAIMALNNVAVRVNSVQSFTDAQKAQARANIGAASVDASIAGAVMYSTSQTLSDAEKSRARTNIDALGPVSPVIVGNLEIDSEPTASIVGDAIQLTPMSITGQSILQLLGDLGDNKVRITGVADPVNDNDAVNLGTLYASILKEVTVTGNTPVIDLSSEIDGVAYETLITCTGSAPTSITISTASNTPLLATIVFTTGSTAPTFDSPLSIIGLDDLIPAADTIYEISIRGHRAVWHSWEVGA